MANNSDIEIWKDIPNYEGYYQASNLGNIRSLDRVSAKGNRSLKGRTMKLHTNKRKYKSTVLSKDGQRTFEAHVLVAMTFLGHVQSGTTAGLVVDHIDNNSLNNRADNLQLTTQRKNATKDKKGYTSDYVGVSFVNRTKRWQSSIRHKGKGIYLGTFRDELSAHKVYQAALERVNKGLAPK